MDSEKKVWARKQKKVKGSKEGTQFGRHMAKRKKEECKKEAKLSESQPSLLRRNRTQQRGPKY